VPVHGPGKGVQPNGHASAQAVKLPLSPASTSLANSAEQVYSPMQAAMCARRPLPQQVRLDAETTLGQPASLAQAAAPHSAMGTPSRFAPPRCEEEQPAQQALQRAAAPACNPIMAAVRSFDSSIDSDGGGSSPPTAPAVHAPSVLRHSWISTSDPLGACRQATVH
jgi:hypothetical protein